MAILFSAVGIRAGDAELKFLVGGIPRELEDLEKYVRVENLLIDQSDDVKVSVQASAYRWGVGADANATWDDLPRIMIQMEENRYILSLYVREKYYTFPEEALADMGKADKLNLANVCSEIFGDG